MSEVKTDKLTGVGTAGSIVVTGEGNSTTTNLQQGLAKVWVNLDGVGTFNEAGDSFNVSTLADNGTGNYSINFANNMSNSLYCFNFGAYTSDNNSTNLAGFNSQAPSTSVLRVQAVKSGNVADDPDQACASINGDLA